VIGVAGIMGSGKTTVARVFQGLGAKLIDADALGKDLLKQDEVKQALIEAFGKGITRRGGDIDPARLGAAAFKGKKEALKLDEITRKALIAKIRTAIEEVKGSERVVVIDAALLPEWTSRSWIDVLVVVDSDEESAIERCCRDSRFKADNVRARMKHQYSRKQKSQEADVIIPNFGTLEELKDRAEKVFWTLMGIS
jgi:dephospho-CoA kinase